MNDYRDFSLLQLHATGQSIIDAALEWERSLVQGNGWEGQYSRDALKEAIREYKRIDSERAS